MSLWQLRYLLENTFITVMALNEARKTTNRDFVFTDMIEVMKNVLSPSSDAVTIKMEDTNEFQKELVPVSTTCGWTILGVPGMNWWMNTNSICIGNNDDNINNNINNNNYYYYYYYYIDIYLINTMLFWLIDRLTCQFQ